MAYSYDQTMEIPEGLRSGYNGSGSDIAGNRVLTGNYNAVTLTTLTTSIVIGVSRSTIKDGYRGEIATRGLVPVLVGTGGWTKGQRLMPEAAGGGAAIPWSASAGTNASVVGVAHEDGTQGGYALVELSGPGVISQG